MLTFDLRH